MGFFSRPPRPLQLDISQGMSHNMTWDRVLLDWAGKLDEIHITDTSIRALCPQYGLATELHTASFDDIKKFITLIDRELLAELPSQAEAIPRTQINALKKLLTSLGYTPEALAQADHQMIIDEASQLSAEEQELLENNNLFELTRLSMMFEVSDPIQNHLIALNHIRQTMHQGGLLYAMPRALETRVSDNYDIKRSLGAPSRAQSSFQQEVFLRVAESSQLDVNIQSSFMGLVRDDFGDEIIHVAEERAHAIANTHCLIPLNEEAIAYDFRKAECNCHHKELSQLLRHRSLLEENHVLKDILEEQLKILPAEEGAHQQRLREKINLLSDIEKVLNNSARSDSSLIKRIAAMLEKPQPPFISLHLEHFCEKHHPRNRPNVEAIKDINQQRDKLANRLALLVKDCQTNIDEYLRVINSQTVSIHSDVPVYSASMDDKDICGQKKAVLEAALSYVNGEISADDFLNIRVANPRWNESTFGSRAEKIVNGIIDIMEGRNELLQKLDMAIEKLKIKLVEEPSSKKHQHKLAVLETAKETLLENLDDDTQLDEAIRTNPDWNKGLFSKTEKLIEAVRQVRAEIHVKPSAP